MNKLYKSIIFIISICAFNIVNAQLPSSFQFDEPEEDKIQLPDVPKLFDPTPILELYNEVWSNMSTQSPEVYFNFPINTNLSEKIIDLINNAKSEILINAYAITDVNIAQALLRAKALNNVLVILILEPRPSIMNYRTPTFLIENSLLTFYSQDEGINNNSYIIVDKKHVATGSFQYTRTSQDRNAENLIVFKNNVNVATAYYLNFLLHLSVSEIPELQLLKTPDIREEILTLLELK